MAVMHDWVGEKGLVTAG